MIERFKTLLLVVLVLTSLLQTYWLAYSQPEFDPISQSEYVETDWIGSQQEPEDFIFPYEMVLHKGEQKHTVLYPEFQFYKAIYDKIRQRTFAGFRQLEPNAPNFLELQNRLGVEIRFQEPIPIELIHNLLRLRYDTTAMPEVVESIWITMSADEQEVRTYFLTATQGSERVVYEATNADMTVRDVQEWVGFGEKLPNYKTVRGGQYYIPTEPLEDVVGLRVPFERFLPEQMQSSLFVDPAITRNWIERDGTEIYTDGKIGLQIFGSSQWMTYTDPVAPIETEPRILDHFFSAVKFVNQHGGWNGTYSVHGLQTQAGLRPDFHFIQYIQSSPTRSAYPVIPTNKQRFGSVYVSLQQGTVTNYERSLVYLDSEYQAERFQTNLVTGEQLEKRLNQYSRVSEIINVIPAYAASLEEETLKLVPRWAVRLSDGTYEFL